jgi:hypothetical protein
LGSIWLTRAFHIIITNAERRAPLCPKGTGGLDNYGQE